MDTIHSKVFPCMYNDSANPKNPSITIETSIGSHDIAGISELIDRGIMAPVNPEDTPKTVRAIDL